MLIYAATILALGLLCALMAVYARRQRLSAQASRDRLEWLRGNYLRAEANAQQWRVEAQRLRDIVDRVEG